MCGDEDEYILHWVCVMKRKDNTSHRQEEWVFILGKFVLKGVSREGCEWISVLIPTLKIITPCGLVHG